MPQFVVGGQAVIEGVMMKGPESVAIAVRKPDGSITIKQDPCKSITQRNRFLRLPFIRGVVFLLEMTIVGMEALTWSANQQADEDEKLGGWALGTTIALSFLFALALFVGVPYLAAEWLAGRDTPLFHLVDGGLRLGAFLGYLGIISLAKDVKRLFQYHGAEHKTVNCYEAGQDLTVENVHKHSLLHPRCGTSLIVFVIAISILLFALVHSSFWYVNIASRIVLIPVIAGISYEILRTSAKHKHNPFFKTIMQPGLWVQRLTTRKPDDKQVECAITALKLVVADGNR